MKVDYLIKNKVSEQDFETIIYEWLSQGDYTPDDIIENIITEHNLMYFPVHFYKSSYVGTATASLGYNRQEYYYEYNPSTKRQERKSRTVTDWMPHSQNAFGDVETTVYSGDSKFNFIRSFIEGTYWSASDLMKVGTDAGKNDKLLHLFKLNPTDAWSHLGMKDCQQKASTQIVSGFPSQLVRNFNANLQFTINTHTSLILPCWVFMYDYLDKSYYVAVDGNNPSRIGGIRPENKKRKNTVRAIRWIGWPATIYAAYTGASYYSEANSGVNNSDLKTIGIAILIFIVLGFVVEGIITSIKTASKNRRQEKLNEMKRRKANS